MLEVGPNRGVILVYRRERHKDTETERERKKAERERETGMAWKHFDMLQNVDRTLSRCNNRIFFLTDSA